MKEIMAVAWDGKPGGKAARSKWWELSGIHSHASTLGHITATHKIFSSQQATLLLHRRRRRGPFIDIRRLSLNSRY